MCGIAGFITRSDGDAQRSAKLRGMLDLMRTRGPDDAYRRLLAILRRYASKKAYDSFVPTIEDITHFGPKEDLLPDGYCHRCRRNPCLRAAPRTDS